MSNIEHVTFKNRDMLWEIAADIYLPPSFDPDQQYRAVVANPWGPATAGPRSTLPKNC